MLAFEVDIGYKISDGGKVEMINGKPSRFLWKFLEPYQVLVEKFYNESNHHLVFLSAKDNFAKDGLSGTIQFNIVSLREELSIETDKEIEKFAIEFAHNIGVPEYVEYTREINIRKVSFSDIMGSYAVGTKYMIDRDFTGILRFNLNSLLTYGNVNIYSVDQAITRDYYIDPKFASLQYAFRNAYADINTIIEKFRQPKNVNEPYRQVPMNFISYSPAARNGLMDIYIAREFHTNGLLASGNVATYKLNSDSELQYAWSEFNRIFSGWMVVFEITGDLKPVVLNSLLAIIWYMNPRDTCIFIDVGKASENVRNQIVKCIPGATRPFLAINIDRFKTKDEAKQYLNERMKAMYLPNERPKKVYWEKLIGDEPDSLSIDTLNELLMRKMFNYHNDKNKISSLSPNIIKPKNTMKQKLQPSVAKHEEPSFKHLDDLIGLESVKDKIKKMVTFHRMYNEYSKNGMNVIKPSYNMVFYGEPGTAKTTCAKLIAEIFANEKIIPNNHFRELTRKDLVAEYVGQTAAKTAKVIESVEDGGVIFIDEAYSMAGTGNDFGPEAITEIVAAMDKMPNTVFIFAGYKKEMEDFMKMNTGLQSRVPNVMEFKSYDLKELLLILDSKIFSQGFSMTKEVRKYFAEKIKKDMTDKRFGNGRYIRSLVEQTILEHSIRLYEKDHTVEELSVITKEDIPEMNKMEVTKAIGFASK